MLRARGNLTYSHKPSIDPIIGNELSKICRSVSNQTYGDQFPGRQATFGDMHFYTGEDTTSYKKNNWYIRTLDADANWQSMNATSIIPENIQTGTIQSGVKIADYLPLAGGTMGGKIVFVNEQEIRPDMIGPGTLPVDVLITGYVPAVGGSYVGNIDMTDNHILSIAKLYGINNDSYIDLGADGAVTVIGRDVITLSSVLLTMVGALGLTGDIVASGNITGASIIKAGGTSSQFLKADGSVDSSAYVTAATEQDPIFTAWLRKTNECEEAVLAGQVVFMQNNSKVKLAKANNSTNSNVCGLAIAGALINTACTYVQDGKFTMADWTDVVGAATLTVGSTYYLDPANFGKLTTVAPTTDGQYVISVGLAVASDTLELDIEQGILL